MFPKGLILHSGATNLEDCSQRLLKLTHSGPDWRKPAFDVSQVYVDAKAALLPVMTPKRVSTSPLTEKQGQTTEIVKCHLLEQSQSRNWAADIVDLLVVSYDSNAKEAVEGCA